MAIRDQNVLDRVNTLNTNLETGNIAEVQRNISNRLFGVLDWANNISMDSELYASINSVADASDITTSINTAKADLPSTAININYGTPHPVANSVVTLAAGAPITDTQNAINAMNTALTELNTLPNQITTLRARLQENRRILSEIHNAQSDTRWLNRDILAINTDINTVNANISTCNNLLGNLSTIRQAEQHPDFWNLGSTARQTRNNVTNTFNGAVIAWVNLYVNVWDFAARNSEVTAAKTTYDNNLRSFQQELGLAETIARNTNSLPTSTIPVPNDLGLFIANDTVVNRTILTTAGNTQTEINNIDARLDQLNTLQWVIETLRARYQDNLNRLNRILELQNLEDRMNTVYPGEMARRRNEFLVIRNISRDNLFLWNNLYVPHLPNQNVNIWWAATNVTLDFVRAPLVGPGRFDYTLCDETWNALRNVWWRFEYQLWWQIISIGGITFENNNMADQTMTIENLTINPIEWVTFPMGI